MSTTRDHDGGPSDEPWSAQIIDEIHRELVPWLELETPDVQSHRLQKDALVAQRLTADGFEGKTFKLVIHILMPYASAIIRRWISSGDIFRRTVQHHCNTYRHGDDSRWAEGVCDALTSASVLEGVTIFRRQLEAGKWKPELGRSLSSYFVGSCVHGFSKVYKERQKYLQNTENYGWPHEFPEYRLKSSELHRPNGPEEEAIANDEVSRLLGQMPEKLRQALELHIETGCSHKAAAEAVGMTPKAMERQLDKFRKKLIKRFNPSEPYDDETGEQHDHQRPQAPAGDQPPA